MCEQWLTFCALSDLQERRLQMKRLLTSNRLRFLWSIVSATMLSEKKSRFGERWILRREHLRSSSYVHMRQKAYIGQLTNDMKLECSYETPSRISSQRNYSGRFTYWTVFSAIRDLNTLSFSFDSVAGDYEEAKKKSCMNEYGQDDHRSLVSVYAADKPRHSKYIMHMSKINRSHGLFV